MAKHNIAPTAERFVDETLALIVEKGGSSDVNLRAVSRRVGCAHTNVYNYFDSFDDLLWAAFRATLDHYGEFLARDLDSSLPPGEHRQRLITNLVTYPQDNPGLYRFIGSDPVGPEFPSDILRTVVSMKRWLVDAFAASAPNTDPAVAEEACNIVYAYIDGETFNLINQRTVPGEDVAGRIVTNAMRLFSLLVPADPDT
jgi:AcrR family transcriptional regulator